MVQADGTPPSFEQDGVDNHGQDDHQAMNPTGPEPIHAGTDDPRLDDPNDDGSHKGTEERSLPSMGRGPSDKDGGKDQQHIPIPLGGPPVVHLER